jgi:hypothetical protein
MYHTIELTVELRAALAGSSAERPEGVYLPAGTRLPAEVRPYVVDTPDGPVEVADLFFADGTAAHGVPFACFSFID